MVGLISFLGRNVAKIEQKVVTKTVRLKSDTKPKVIVPFGQFGLNRALFEALSIELIFGRLTACLDVVPNKLLE